MVLEVLGNEFSVSKIRKDLKDMNPKERLSFFERLAKLVIPKEQDFKINYDKLTDEDMDRLIEKLQDNE